MQANKGNNNENQVWRSRQCFKGGIYLRKEEIKPTILPGIRLLSNLPLCPPPPPTGWGGGGAKL